MIVSAYGFIESPLEISNALQLARVGHYAVMPRPRTQIKKIGRGGEPVIIPGLKYWNRYQPQGRQILLISDSRAALSTTNVPLSSLADISQIAEDQSRTAWALFQNEPTVASYVDIATKPSVLNNIQTLIYLITPYDLRKEVQGLVISYLAGATSKRILMDKLNSNYKLERIKNLITTERCRELRLAVAMLRHSGAEEVAALTGFQQFELLYLSKSASKNK